LVLVFDCSVCLQRVACLVHLLFQVVPNHVGQQQGMLASNKACWPARGMLITVPAVPLAHLAGYPSYILPALCWGQSSFCASGVFHEHLVQHSALQVAARCWGSMSLLCCSTCRIALLLRCWFEACDYYWAKHHCDGGQSRVRVAAGCRAHVCMWRSLRFTCKFAGVLLGLLHLSRLSDANFARL
jgi:hypothetical protein